MRVRDLKAESFRNLRIGWQSLSPGINILYGDNAQGKTNFLEAIYFCALGRSTRADNLKELIGFGQKEAHVQAELVKDNISSLIDAHIQMQGKKCVKSLSIDKVPVKNTRELFGRLLVVLFSPEDLRLIKSGPAERRRFMDIEICQLSPVYYSDLKEYHRALKQRNHLLKILRKDKNQRSFSVTLSVWDDQLANYGKRIIRTRTTFVKRISELAGVIHAGITHGAEALAMEYRPNIENPDDYIDIMKKSHDRDLALGCTSAGVHKDDIHFTINNISARSFGSQGQQRTAALSAKLAEIEIMRQSTSTTPVLLLDDVLSELDGHRQTFLLQRITAMQTVLTCTGLEDVLKKNPGDYRIMKVENGQIKS